MGEMADIKFEGKTLPSHYIQGKVEVVAEAIRQVVRDADAFYITEQAE
jgi:hypothetical protein